MSAKWTDIPGGVPGGRIFASWVPVALGLCVLYVPTFYGLSRTIWRSDEQAHGPIVLAVAIWVFWTKRHEWLRVSEAVSHQWFAWISLVFSLLIYVVGRSQDILLFELGSALPLVASAIYLVGGRTALWASWFGVLFLVFMVPLPSVIVDSLTAPLKNYVSVIAEHILYWVGYPIARDGVMLTIGQYQLLVADACSGLHSMFSLSALGVLYLYISAHQQLWRVLTVIAAILPIAFVANIIRVIILVLVTYHFGDEAGQGFVHGFAGMILFVTALCFLFALDGLLGLLGRALSRQRSE